MCMQRLLNFVLVALLMYLGYQWFQQTNSADKISALQRKSPGVESSDFGAILKAKRLRAAGKRCGYVGIDSFFGRTGNRLFLYAFAFALAKRLERRLAIPANTPLLHGVFHVTAVVLNASDIERFEPLYELYEHDANFTLIGLKARLECERSYLIRRYAFSYLEVDIFEFLQYKYFEAFEAEIRSEFRFLPEIDHRCNAMLQYYRTKAGRVLVGVHIRRGDFLDAESQRIGHLTASREYVQSAINHIKDKLNESTMKFVMLGNDHQWNDQHFGNNSEIFLLEADKVSAVDMCLLSRCDHVIITTGTFGWWAAYFNEGGLKIYPKQQVRPNSFLANAAKPYETYFPPHWIGL